MGPERAHNELRDARAPRADRIESVPHDFEPNESLPSQARFLLSLQQRAGNRAVSALLQRRRDAKVASGEQLRRAPVQRVAWHNKASGTAAMNTVPSFAGLQNNNAMADISVSGYPFQGHQYELGPVNGATKIDVLTRIAEAVGGKTYPESGKFLKKSQLQGIPVDHSLVDANTIANVSKRNIYRGGVDPFLVRASGLFNGFEVALHYQFGVDSYGYVVKIEQENKTYTMHPERGQEALSNAQRGPLQAGANADPLFDKYASAHDTAADEVIADTASRPTSEEALPPVPGADVPRPLGPTDAYVTSGLQVLGGRGKRLDAMTKLAGEGARWECVRRHATRLRNSSRFYTRHPDGSRRKAYITFERLWGMWGSHFNSEFNIANARVVQVIGENLANANLIGTMTPEEAASDVHFDLDN